MDKKTALSALQGLGELGGDSAFKAIPGGELVKKILDAALAAATTFTGIQSPSSAQLAAFVAQLSPTPMLAALAAGAAYDWWRDDGWAGGKTLPVLLTASEIAGWPGPAQASLAFYWYSAVEAMPGKGGWKGKAFWKGKLDSYKAGKPTVIVIETIGFGDVQKTIQKPKIAAFKTQLANDVAQLAPSAWASPEDAKGLASFAEAPPIDASGIARIAKALLLGDKIGTLAGATLIKNGQVLQLAAKIDADSAQLLADQSVTAGGGAAGNFVSDVGAKPGDTTKDSGGIDGDALAGILIAAAVGAALS